MIIKILRVIKMRLGPVTERPSIKPTGQQAASIKSKLMKKYQIQNSIGSGNFSTVFKGVLLPDLTPCAIKILKSHHNIACRQAQLLKKFKHPNIISIIDFEQTPSESRIILQYMGINTLQLIQANPHGLKQEQVKCILFQSALALSCVHSHRIIHRDVKPENILIDKKLAIVKLIDFGLAIQTYQVSTDYVATRWYRAPENLLNTKQYGCAIDVFSLGCVIVELYLGYPLFPGKDNMDQIYKIFGVLGYPTPQSWPKGYQKLIQLGLSVNQSQMKPPGLKSVMNSCDPRLLELVEKMLQINPRNRISCEEILKHQYFRNIRVIVPPSVYRRFQEDILTIPKPLNFKGFQPTRSSKNSSNEGTLKQSKINFHHVTAKVKQQQPPKQVSIQKSPTFRQHKSSSVDSYQLAQSASSQTLQNGSQIKNIPSLAELNSKNRKLSTPSLASQPFVRSSQQIRINTDNFIMNSKWNRESTEIGREANSNNQSKKNYVEMIPQDDQPEMTISTRIPDGESTPTFHPKIPQHNVDYNKHDKPTNNYPPEHRPYPSVMNVQYVQQPISYNNSQLFPRFPNNSSLILNKQQMANNSIQLSHEPPKPMYISLKPVMVESRSPLELAQNNFSGIRSFNDSQIIADQSRNNDVGKKLRNFPSAIPQFLHRENFGIPNNPSRFQHILKKPEINYRSPNHHVSNKQVFLSPLPRVPASSPQNNLNSGRHRRLQAVNGPPQPFYMLQHRKY